jgi:NAD(P)-dependent dehydrogenase (short-subunit alcohol dehydrogenase family)
VSSRPAGDPAAVLGDFQAVMAQFLDLQRAMIPAYVGSPPRQVLRRLPAADVPAAEPPPVDPPAVDLRLAVLPPASLTPADPPPVATAVDRSGGTACGRYRVVVADRPLSGARGSLARDRVVVITDDGRGIAERVRVRLRLEGFTVATISTDGNAATHSVATAIDSVADAERIVAQIVERHGPIAALVHLMPLTAARAYDTLDAAVLWERLGHDTRTLFMLARAMGAELEKAARNGGAAVIACTGMGGCLGHGLDAESAAPALPDQAGILGFTKCLALEWPAVRVRAVDLDPSESSDALAGYVLDELWAKDEEREVGYARGRRVGLDIVAAAATLDPGFDLPGDAVVLATGGARGITADICLELAARCQPTFVLVGQSALPAGMESAETADLTAPSDLKRVLMNRLQAGGERVTPAVVEKAYRQIEKDREIRRNIGALTGAGARVHYVQLDVRDPAALGALVDDVYATYGRLDGVLHGAGIIEDKLVRDKSLDSFERVFSTKALSAFALTRHLRPESLRFLVFFSSVAGRFGNRGQSDYAAANEVVSTLALALNRRWPGRICSIAWAPWDKRGMVSPELRREFVRRGVELVSPEAGRRACWAELQQGGSADAQVVIGGAAPSAVAGGPGAEPGGEPLPLLLHARREDGPAGAVRFTRLLDVAIDRYLDDHRLDERPVLPLAVASELMAEAAQATWPGLTVLAVRGLQLFKGIVLQDGPVPLVVSVRPAMRAGEHGLTEADVDITTPGLTPALRYRAVIQLGPRLPEPTAFDPPSAALSALPVPLDTAYREWTFHGPMFRRVTQIQGISATALVGSVFSSTAVPVLDGATRPRWIFDPFVFDAALQLLLIWSRATHGMTALPSRFQAFRRYGSLSDQPLTCHVAIESSAGGHALKNDIHFVDAGGRVVAVLNGMEASCTAALNRLTARDTRLTQASS